MKRKRTSNSLCFSCWLSTVSCVLCSACSVDTPAVRELSSVVHFSAGSGLGCSECQTLPGLVIVGNTLRAQPQESRPLPVLYGGALASEPWAPGQQCVQPSEEPRTRAMSAVACRSISSWLSSHLARPLSLLMSSGNTTTPSSTTAAEGATAAVSAGLWGTTLATSQSGASPVQ